MNKTYLIIGGNVGNKAENLAAARHLIEARVGKITNLSAIYETEPWGKPNQPFFYNQVLLAHTHLNKLDLLIILQNIEKELGRIRYEKYGERIIDIDILFFNNEVYTTQQLTIPHKHIAERNFVLMPMAEIAPLFLHPVLQKSMSALVSESGDKLSVKKLEVSNSII